ncbi:MAG: hypothetical protein V1929_13870 [bacterium]
MNRRVVLFLAVMLASVFVAPVFAFDLGDPVYKGDLKGDVRFELIFENFDRDAVFTDYTISLAGPGGTVSEDVEDTDTSTESEGRLIGDASVSGGIGAAF